MTEEDWDRFYFNCTGRHLGDPIPPEELVDADEFFENPTHFNKHFHSKCAVGGTGYGSGWSAQGTTPRAENVATPASHGTGFQMAVFVGPSGPARDQISARSTWGRVFVGALSRLMIECHTGHSSVAD